MNERTNEYLKQLQSLPLDAKVGRTTSLIRAWYHNYDGKVYVSFSGGKDSTVLLDIARQMFPDIKAAFSNTGLEYPEIQSFVRKHDNVDVVRPSMMFNEVVSEYGYPLISKEVGEAIYYARRIVPVEVEREREQTLETETPARARIPRQYRMELTNQRLFRAGNIEQQWNRLQNERNSQDTIRETGPAPSDGSKKKNSLQPLNEQSSSERESPERTKSQFNKEKWLPLCREAPFKISHYCCTVMKKRPLAKYEKENGLKPILATMAEESRVRKQAWIRHGCNAFDGAKQVSQPMSFWTEQDVLEYIRTNKLEIASVYGDIKTYGPDGKEVLPVGNIGYFKMESNDYIPNMEGCTHRCDKCQRTGCIFCGFGLHLEKGLSRFQRLATTHPRQYEYCINGGQWIDNPDYDPTDTGEPDEMGWINWNPKKIWVPSKEGLGMGYVFDFVNQLYGKELMRYK